MTPKNLFKITLRIVLSQVNNHNSKYSQRSICNVTYFTFLVIWFRGYQFVFWYSSRISNNVISSDWTFARFLFRLLRVSRRREGG